MAARPEEAFREPATLAAKVPASLRPRCVLLSLKIVLAGLLRMVIVAAPLSGWLLDWADQHSWVLFCPETCLWLYDVMLVPDTA